MHDFKFKPHFWWDFLAYCISPVCVYLTMLCVSCSFNSFSIFLLSLKQQNLMKIVFLYPFSNMAISSKIMKKNVFYILVNCITVWVDRYGAIYIHVAWNPFTSYFQFYAQFMWWCMRGTTGLSNIYIVILSAF